MRGLAMFQLVLLLLRKIFYIPDKSIYALGHPRFELSTPFGLRLHEGLGDVPTRLTAAQENLPFSKKVNICIGSSSFRTLDSTRPPTA